MQCSLLHGAARAVMVHEVEGANIAIAVGLMLCHF
jgi:hypothetical protein